MSYLSTFATAQTKPRTLPTDEELAGLVAEAIDMLPAQSRGIWQAARMHEMMALYAEADPFVAEIYWIGLRHAIEAMRAHALLLRSLPVFVSPRDGEDSDTYLDRCYAASGFLPACGTWGNVA